jgi:hypothetical protein
MQERMRLVKSPRAWAAVVVCQLVKLIPQVRQLTLVNEESNHRNGSHPDWPPDIDPSS